MFIHLRDWLRLNLPIWVSPFKPNKPGFSHPDRLLWHNVYGSGIRDVMWLQPGKHCMHVPPLICEPHAFSLGKAMPWYTSKALLSESVLSHRVVCDTALWGPTSISGADCLGPAPLDGLGFWQGTSTIVFLWCKQPKIYYALGRYSVCECMDTYWVHIKQRSDLERKLTGLRAEAWLPQWNRSKTLWVWAKSLQMNSPLFIYLFVFFNAKTIRIPWGK